MKLRIYNITHKPLNLVVNSLFQPIIVGNKEDKLVPASFLRDDINDNIADKSSNFCELTAIYWLWKNVHDIDYIGICHYRRYLNFKDLYTFKHLKEIDSSNKSEYDLNIICSDRYYDKILSHLIKGYTILPKKRKFRRTIYDQYKKYHVEADLKKMKTVLFEKYPDYKESFNTCFVKRKKGYFYNMMILPKSDFNDYCSWLFDILFELERRIKPSEDFYQKRVYGFLSERLLGLYIYHNKVKVKEKQILSYP